MTPASSSARPPLGADEPAAGGALPLVGWTLALVAGVVLLHSVGGALAPPPLGGPGQLARWLDQREPAEAAMAVVRLVALGMAWYLLAVTVAGTVARLAGVRTLVRAVDIVTVPAVRRLVTGALGVSMAAAIFTGAGGAAVADERSGAPAASTTETMRRLPDAEEDGTDPSPLVAGPAETPVQQTAAASPPTMRRLPAAAAEDDSPVAPPPSTPPTSAPAVTASTATTATAAPPSAGAPAPALPGPAPANQAPAPDTASAASAARTWRVEPGDHFWSVAERVLAEVWHHSPTDAEVEPYWRELVDANRSVLRDADNPDLLFPGQVITVPAPPPARLQGR